MKTLGIPNFVFACLLHFVLFLADSSRAADRTWTGAINSFWSEAGNWSPAGAPETGDSLLFPASATRYTSQNDLPPPVRLTRMELAGGGYQLTGSNVILQSDFTDSHSSGDANEVSFTLFFSGAATVNVTGAQEGLLLEIRGQIRAGASENITISVHAGTLKLYDALVGSGAVIKRGHGVLHFSSFNPNVYYGGMYVLEGTAFLHGNKPVYAETGTGRLTVGSNGVSQATVYVGSTPWAGQVGVEVNDSHIQFDHPTGVHFLTLREGAIVDGDGSLTIYGSITSNADVLAPVIKLPLNIFPPFTGFNIHGAIYPGIDIQTPIGGPGGISKSGNSPLVLRYSNSFTGNVTVADGILDASGANALGLGTNVTVHNKGALTLRNIDVSGKTLEAYTRDQVTADLVGTRLTVIGAASWSGPVVLRTNLVVLGGDMDFTGPISGPGGMVFLNGTSTFGGSTANTFTGPTLALGSLLRVNKTSGARAFSSPLTVGGPLSGPCEVQWLQDYQCVGADVTLFQNSFVNLNNHREDFGPVTFNAGTISTGASGELGLYGLLTVNPSAGAATIDGRLGLPPGIHEFQVNDGGAWPDLRVNAHLLGAGHLRKTGAGQLWLATSNSYTGVTFIDAGTLSALNACALGAATAGTTVSEGATLDLNAITTTMPESLALRGTGVNGNGALDVFGLATLRSTFPSIYAAIDLTTNTTINVRGGSLLTVDGFISGIGPLTKMGAGTLLFANANENTYVGDTIVADGTLDLAKPNNVIAVPGDLVAGPAPFGSAVLVRWTQNHALNSGATITVNAGSLLDLNGRAQSLARLNLNDGGDVQTGAGVLNFPGAGLVNVSSLTLLGSHTGSSISGNIGLPPNGAVTFSVAPFAPTPPFDFGPELDVSAGIPAPPENVLFERAGLHKNGLGRMRLSGNNSYRGWTDVAEGTLEVAGDSALGVAFGGTYVFNSGTLELQNGITIGNETVVLNSTATPALFSWAGDNVWGGLITLQRDSTVGVGTGNEFRVNGVIGGTGHFTKIGLGTLVFQGPNHNTYAGDTYVNEGLLYLAKPVAVTAVPQALSVGTPAGLRAVTVNYSSYQIIGNIFINRGGVWNVYGHVENVDHLWLVEGGDVFTETGVLSIKTGGSIQVVPGNGSDSATLSGIVEFLAGAHSLNVGASTSSAGGPDLDVGAWLTSAGETITLQKDGPGTARFSANNSYVGTTVVNGGVLRIDGFQTQSPVQVNPAGTLQGNGGVGSIAFLGDGGLVAPGASAGVLSCNGFNINSFGSGMLEMELNGTLPGTEGYDQLIVNGLVTLSEITLGVRAESTAALHQQFILISNDGADAVQGTFTGLPENATVTAGDQVFQISYAGGDGNDVVLTKTGNIYRPSLTIERVVPSSVRLLWPTNDPAFTLQFTTNLNGTNVTDWASVPDAPFVVGTNRVVTNSSGGSWKFYRLFRP